MSHIAHSLIICALFSIQTVTGSSKSPISWISHPQAVWTRCGETFLFALWEKSFLLFTSKDFMRWVNLLWIRILDFFFSRDMISLSSSSVSLSEDPAQIGKGISLITVLDINDNAPEFAIDYETLLCENTLPGQVSPLPLVFPPSVKPQLLFLFTWMFTHKDNPLTMITMIKSLYFAPERSSGSEHVCLTAGGHSPRHH